jgi:hypothetical protein
VVVTPNNKTNGSRAGRVRRDTGEVNAAAVEFDEEQHRVTTQQDGVASEEVARHDPRRLRAQERRPRLRVPTRGGVDTCGLEDRPHRRPAIVMPSRASSPWMCRYPHVGFS